MDVHDLRPSKGGSPSPFLRSHSLRGLSPGPVRRAVERDGLHRRAEFELQGRRAERADLQRRVAGRKKAGEDVPPAELEELARLSKEVSALAASASELKAELDAELGLICAPVDEVYEPPPLPPLPEPRPFPRASECLASPPLPLLLSLLAELFPSNPLPSKPPPKSGKAPPSPPCVSPLLPHFANSWLPLKSLPSQHASISPTSLHVLVLLPPKR
ncbi:hypothetical protein TeGR_g832, partial [Tetraparma gracilis]